VFAAEPLEGNQLAVVHDADALGEVTMLAFARETGLSETTFVQSPTEPGATYRNRIWWSHGEMPFAGHPSLGTAVAVALRRGEGEAHYVQQTPAGLQPVEVQLSADGARAQASMLQEPAVFGPEPAAAAALAAVGLDPRDGHPELPPQVVGTGLTHLLIPVRDPHVLHRCAPQLEALLAALSPHGAGCAYVVAVDPDLGIAQARSFFEGRLSAVEDPATGSAAGPLCAYLQQRCGGERVMVDQGVAMGRPSRIVAEMDGDRVRVSGDVVIVATGDVRL